jgi:hypothetical protein
MGSTKCEPGCSCYRHNRGSVIDWNDPEARKKYNRDKAAEAYAADPEPFRERARQYRADHPGRRGRLRNEAVDLKYMYGITPERWQEMFDAQGGCCYLCGEPLDVDAKGRGVGISTDHDHSCCRGRRSCGSCIRGLACMPCNAGIGNFGDDPERMRRVADNLEMANRRLRDTRPVRG